jgi:hypothetical protein
VARQEAYRLLLDARNKGKIITLDEPPYYGSFESEYGYWSKDGYWVKPCKAE